MNANTITVTRRQTAREEIDLAIHLVFTQGSLISANLLAWAAIDVLRGVAKAQGKETFNDGVSAFIKEGKQKAWLDIIKEHYNFAKHANHDPDKIIEMNVAAVEFTLLNAVSDFAEVYGAQSLPMMLLSTYMFALHPDIVKESGADKVAFGKKLFGEEPSRDNVARYYDMYLANKAYVDAKVLAVGNLKLEV